MADRQDSSMAQSVWTRRGFVAALGVLATASNRGWAVAGENSLDSWRRGFRGRSVVRDEVDFEAWRTAMPWQMYKPPRRPDLIARPDSAGAVADVL